MPTTFLESFGGSLGQRWFTTLFTPAFVFWLGGLMVLVEYWGWNRITAWWEALGEPTQYGLLVGSLLLIAASAGVVRQFDLAVIQFLEGYWPGWMGSLRRRLIHRQRRLVQQKEKRWQQLALQHDRQGLTSEEMAEYVALDYELRQFPAQSDRLMPTQLGNRLRAAEEQPRYKYGLDAIICWPRLWLLLPDSAKKELQESRSTLNNAARMWLWSLLFLIWGLWIFWAIPIGVLVAFFSYRWMVSIAITYGNLVESSFDLYRLSLYQSLHWPLPKNSAEEFQKGQQLTEYLWRGSNQIKLEFSHE
jgi:hypothetical protein